MRTLIIIVILQLAINLIEANNEEKFHFGDLIAFPKCDCRGKIVYKHYAVYVGDKAFHDKKKEQVIFERTGKVKSLSDCIFSELGEKVHFKDNFLDDTYPVGKEENIMERIKEKHHKCGIYEIFGNNCEHVATYVRYGVRVSIQHGAFSEGKCRNGPEINVKEILDKINKKPFKFDESCSKDCQAVSSNNG